MVVGWADLRMPRTMHGQRDAKMIAEIGFEHFSNWDISVAPRVNQATVNGLHLVGQKHLIQMR